MPVALTSGPRDAYPDKVAHLADGWAVRFDGCVQEARFNDRGPAVAHLDLLRAGAVQPSPQHMFCSKSCAEAGSGHPSVIEPARHGQCCCCSDEVKLGRKPLNPRS